MKTGTEHDMTQGAVAVPLIGFTIPLVLGNFFQLFYNAVDSIIVGRYVGESALAAVGTSTPVMNLVILLISGLCMRNAGLPVESMIEYVHLFQEGDETIPARLHLLLEQKEHLIEQQNKISQMLKRLEYKISRYEEAVQTGKLVWDEDKAEECRKL